MACLCRRRRKKVGVFRVCIDTVTEPDLKQVVKERLAVTVTATRTSRPRNPEKSSHMCLHYDLARMR